MTSPHPIPGDTTSARSPSCDDVFKLVVTLCDFHELWRADRAVLLIWVSWSMQARDALGRFREFVRAWDEEQPTVPVAAYLVDVSEGNGELWTALQKWLRDERQRDELLSWGYGALLTKHPRPGRAGWHVVRYVEQVN